MRFGFHVVKTCLGTQHDISDNLLHAKTGFNCMHWQDLASKTNQYLKHLLKVGQAHLGAPQESPSPVSSGILRHSGGRESGCPFSVLCSLMQGKSFVPFLQPLPFVCTEVVSEGFSPSRLAAQELCTAKFHICMRRASPYCHFFWSHCEVTVERGKWGQAVLAEGSEEAGSDFMWKIEFPQWGKWSRVLSKVEEGIPSCSPASVTLGNHVLSHGHFEHVTQGDSSLWASVEMSDELQWEMNSHRGERGCPAPFAKTAGSYWSVLEGDKAQPDRQDLIA